MYSLVMDYCTFNFDAGSVSPETISNVLTGGLSDLNFKAISLSENSPLQSYLGVNYLNNSGFALKPHRVQISGVGCTHFEPLLPELRKIGNSHLSRVDFAFDVIVSREQWIKYISNAFAKSLSSDRKSKKYVLSGSGEAMTVYIGSRKCAKFCRIYNKSLQDPEYNYYDENGDRYLIPIDAHGNPIEYIIRYEVELKRFKGNGQNFDPSYLFDSYFGNKLIVIDFIKDVWRLYAEDFLLPCNIDDLDFVCRSDKYKFCSISDAAQFIDDRIIEKPHVFDSTISYVAERFGKYIPWILINPLLRNICLQKCKNYSGLDIDLVVSVSESAFYDLESEGDDSNSSVQMWKDVQDFDQLQIT